MPRWIFTVVGALAAAALYTAMAVAFADVAAANIVVGAILFGGVGAVVTTVFVAGRSRRRQPRV